MVEKRVLGDAKKFVPFYVFSLHFRSRNALRAARPILYTEISHLGKYLTYEIRDTSDIKKFVGVDAHIDPHLSYSCPPDRDAEYFDYLASLSQFASTSRFAVLKDASV